MEHSIPMTKEKQIPPLYQFTAKAYLWMFIGLMCTALTSIFMLWTGFVYFTVMYTWIPLALIAAKLILVGFLSARIHKMSAAKSRIIFILYSFLVGITFSAIGLIYDLPTIFIAFLFAAILFACLAIIGFTTKKDMTKFGPLLFGGLIALLLVELIGMFIGFQGMDLLIGLFGIILFLGLTVYDTQKMKNYYNVYQNDHMMLDKLSIFFALQLYLDFINMFLYLLRIMGRKK